MKHMRITAGHTRAAQFYYVVVKLGLLKQRTAEE